MFLDVVCVTDHSTVRVSQEHSMSIQQSPMTSSLGHLRELLKDNNTER